MKKGEIARSHSWWWDSHISPKNSKWLQENLAEMDSKVNAMLKIIEEDADSFAQRAEMYYRKRPELIALVEDFYRTYRALVERYTFLTKEIRQNIAPALQAQLGITPDSAQNSPIDLHTKRGIDGFDIVSPSYSYTGASEFDYDSPSEVSAKGNTDDELSPLGFGTTYNDRPFGSKAKFAGDHARRGGSDTGGLDISQLQKDLRHLQDENKAFAAKSFEDAARLKNLESELSSLQVRLRSLEADDKATKKKLKSVQEQEQKLEAENLKLNHALILSKEEKSDLVEQCNKKVELACSRNKQLEDEVATLRKENLEIHAQALERLEHIQKAEESIQKVQNALASMEEQSRKESLLLRETIEQQSQEFRQKLLAIEEENAKLRKQTEADATAMKELEDRLTKLITYRNDLEQLFLDSEKEKKICLEEKAAALAKIDELQKELYVVQTDKQSMSEQILQGDREIAVLKSIKCKLEDDIVRHEAAKLEGEKHITKLEEEIKEGNKVRDTLTDQCRHSEDRCKALEAVEIQLRNELATISFENAKLQERKSTLEDVTAKANLQIKELQENVTSLASEKAVVVAELENAGEKLKRGEIEYGKMQEMLVEKDQKINKLDEDITTQLVHIKKLENDISFTLKEKAALEERESKALRILSDLQKEHCLLGNQLEEERSHCARSLTDHQEAASKLQEDLSRHQEELKKLQHEGHVKDKVIEKVKVQLNLLEEQLEKSKNDNKLLGIQNDEFVKQLADLEAQIGYLKEKLSESLAVNVSLADEVSEKGKMIEVLNAELSSLRSQNIALTEDIALKTGHELGLQEQVKTLKEQVEFLHSDLQRSLEKRHALEAEIEKLQESCQKHEEANKSLLDEQRKLFDEISLRKKDSEDLELNIKHLIGEREKHVDEISIVKKSNEDLGVKIQKLTEERDHCLNEICLIKKTSEDLETKIKHVMEERAAFMTESASRLKECTDLNSKIKSLENECQLMEAENGSLKGMLERSQEEKKTFEIENACLMKKLSDVERRLEQEIVKLQQACNKVQETDGARLQEQKKHSDEISLMKKGIEDLEASLQTVRDEKFRLKEEASACLEQCNKMKERIHILENDLQMTQIENGSLKNVIANYEKDKHKMQEENASLMEKHTNVQRQLKEEIEKVQQACLKLEEKYAFKVLEEQRHLNAISSMKKRTEQLEENLVQLTEERDLLLKEVSECSQKIKGFESDFLLIQSENQSLKKANDSLMKKLSEAEGRFVEETEKLQRACKVLEEKDAALRINLKHLTDERMSLQKEVSARLEECATMKEAIMIFERDVAVSQTENGSLKVVIASIEKEKNDMEKSNADLTEKLSEARGRLVDLESMLSNALNENASLRDNVLLNEMNITSLEADLVALQNKNLVLDQDVGSLQGQVSAMKGREESLLLDLTKRSEEIQMLKAENEQLCNDLLLKENSLASLEADHLALQSKHVALDKDFCSLQDQVSAMKDREELLLADLTKRSEEVQILNAEIELLRADVLLKGNNITSLEADLLALQNKYVALDKDICSLQDHVSAMKDREELLLADLSKKSEEIQMLKAETALLNDNVHQRENRIANLEADLIALQNYNLALNKDVLSLQGQVSAMKGREESLLSDLSKRSEETQTLKAEIELLRDDVHQKENVIASLEAEFLASQNKNQALDNDVCSLQDQVSAMKDREELLLADLSKRSEQIQLLHDDVHQKEKVIASLEAEFLASQNKNQALDNNICFLQGQVSTMEGREELLLADLSKRSEEIQTLQTEIQLLRERSFVMEKEIEELHEGVRRGHEERSVLSRDIAMHSENSSALKLKIEKLEEEKASTEKAAVLVENSLKEKLSGLESENTKLCHSLESQKEEVQKLTKAIMRLEEENKSALDRMNLVIAERDMLDMKSTDLQKEFESANKKLRDLEDELVNAKKQNSDIESVLKDKVDDLKKLQEYVLALEAAKVDVEKQLQFNSTVTKGYQEESEILKRMLSDVQDELKKLEDLSSQSMMDYKDAQKTILDCNQNLENQRNDIEILKKELSSLDVVKMELEQALHHSNEEKTALNTKLRTMHEELSCLQKEHEISLHNVEALNVQLHEKVELINELQEKQNATEKEKVYMAELQTKTNSERDAQLKLLEEEITHLKSENLQCRNELTAQFEDMIKLKDEHSSLQAHRDSLQNERDISMKQVINGQQDIEKMKAQIQEKEEERSKMVLKIEQLKQSLVHAEEQSANLRKCLQQVNDELDASKQIMKDEVSILHRDLTVKVALISDMNATVSRLEKKSATQSEELAFKDEMISELQRKLSTLQGDNKALTMTSESQAAEISSLKSALKELQEVEIANLKNGLDELQTENKSIAATQASESISYAEEMKTLSAALSSLEDENKTLKARLSAQSAELSDLEKLATVADAREREANQLHLRLDQVMEENKEAKKQIHCASEEVSQVKGEIKNLMIQIQIAQERYQEEHAKYNASVAEYDSLQKEFEKLKDTVSTQQRAAGKVEEEVSSLYKNKNDMEAKVASMSCELKETQLVSENLLKIKDSLRHELDRIIKLFVQIVSDLEDLTGLLSSNQNNSLVEPSDISQHMGKQLPSITNGEISGEEPQTSLISENLLDSLKDSDVAVKECENVASAIGDAIRRLKEKVLKLQEENHMLKITSQNDHNDIEASLRELQSDFSRLEDERAHHNMEVSLYRSEVNSLIQLLDGRCEHKESKAGHPEVKQLQDRLYDLRSKAVKMEEENVRLTKEMKTRKDEAGKSQEMLSDVESKCLRYAWQLKNNLVSCHGKVKVIADELHNSSNKTDPVMVMHMERLTNWHKVNDGSTTIELEKGASFNGIKKSATSVVPFQLQERVDESIRLLEALGVLKMMLTETLKKVIFRSEDEAESVTVVDKQEPISSEERLSYSVSNYVESRYADIVSIEDSAKSVRKERTEMRPDEPEEISLVQAHSEQSSPVDGENENNEGSRFSQSRINLGRRLYQAQMDERLENELLELKEERRQLEEELQARVEQVEKMERELGFLQEQLKQGNEQQETMDQRRQHQWLQKKRKVEIRASKLVDELVSQREQIRNLQEVVMSWTKQQEVETGKLEKQVSVLVSQESASTMDGWDDEQVNHLLKEMQTRKAWTRRHSLELKSVEKELRRVSSTIEITQKQLMVPEGGEADLREEDDSDVQGAMSQVAAVNAVSRTSSLNRRHRSRFRLHRFLVFIMPGKKGCIRGCFKRTRSSSHLSPRHSKSATSSAVTVTGKKVKCWTCLPCMKKPMLPSEEL